MEYLVRENRIEKRRLGSIVTGNPFVILKVEYNQIGIPILSAPHWNQPTALPSLSESDVWIII